MDCLHLQECQVLLTDHWCWIVRPFTSGEVLSSALRLSAAKAAPDLARPQHTALSLSQADPYLAAGRSSTRDPIGRRRCMPPKVDDTVAARARVQVEGVSRRRSWCGVRAVLDGKVPVE